MSKGEIGNQLHNLAGSFLNSNFLNLGNHRLIGRVELWPFRYIPGVAVQTVLLHQLSLHPSPAPQHLIA
eukprot:913426-Amphidinium_carterae.1